MKNHSSIWFDEQINCLRILYPDGTVEVYDDYDHVWVKSAYSFVEVYDDYDHVWAKSAYSFANYDTALNALVKDNHIFVSYL